MFGLTIVQPPQCGGWTLIANRKADSLNIESCGTNIMEFFTNGCGNVNFIDKNSSYSLSNIQRNSIFKNKMLITQYLNNILDFDDAYIITFLDHATEPFPNFNLSINIPVMKVCNITNSDCDSTNVYWKYIGDFWFHYDDCNSSSSLSTQYRGNYGLCHDGASNNGNNNTYSASSLFGNRTAYDEIKLWGGTGATSNQEKIWYK